MKCPECGTPFNSHVVHECGMLRRDVIKCGNQLIGTDLTLPHAIHLMGYRPATINLHALEIGMMDYNVYRCPLCGFWLTGEVSDYGHGCGRCNNDARC